MVGISSKHGVVFIFRDSWNFEKHLRVAMHLVKAVQDHYSSGSLKELTIPNNCLAVLATGTTGNLALSSTYLLEYFYEAAVNDDADGNISFLF